MNYGKTIRIYLADGSPTGIRHAELVNWTGQAIVCPRVRIGELAEWEESKKPGVYILFGEDKGGSSRPMSAKRRMSSTDSRATSRTRSSGTGWSCLPARTRT